MKTVHDDDVGVICTQVKRVYLACFEREPRTGVNPNPKAENRKPKTRKGGSEKI